MSVLRSIATPKQQSGQASHKRIYDAAFRLATKGHTISLEWVPAHADFRLRKMAKDQARKATEVDQEPANTTYLASPTVHREAIRSLPTRTLPVNVGRYSKEIDKALPGRHTRKLYDKLTYPEASILAQLRTGMIRLNGYLAKIGAAETDQCPCGTATETVKHFLFTCPLWTPYRMELYL